MHFTRLSYVPNLFVSKITGIATTKQLQVRHYTRISVVRHIRNDYCMQKLEKNHFHFKMC